MTTRIAQHAKDRCRVGGDGSVHFDSFSRHALILSFVRRFPL
jgi:hypothetical protein